MTCGVVLDCERSTRKYCSTACRSKTGYYRDIESRREYERERARRIGPRTEYNRAYYAANQEKRRRYAKAYWAKNREVLLAINREWRTANPERVALYGLERRARERQGGVFRVTERDWLRLVARFRGCCAYCGVKPADGVLHREHVIPLIRGGRHSIGNIVPACMACNYSKNRWLLSEWRYRGRAQRRARPSGHSPNADAT